jgi:uncharacterized protein DUF4192
MSSRVAGTGHVDFGILIAAMPALLHFTPQDSLILVGFTGTGPYRVTFALRVDLPKQGGCARLLDELRSPITRQQLDALGIIVVGGDADSDGDALPHHALVQGCCALAQQLGLVLLPPVWVSAIEADQVWFSYVEAGRFGTVPEPRTTPVSLAAAVVGGDVTYDSRTAFIAQLDPDTAADLSRRARMMRSQPPVVVDDATALLHDVLAHTDLNSGLDDEVIVRLGHVLTHPRVRDAAISLALTGDAQAAEQLWTHLTRATPRPHVTHPATLLAIAAYLRGNGTLAGVALDIALDADPSNVLATLLQTVLHNGIAPQRLKEFLTHAFTATSPESA